MGALLSQCECPEGGYYCAGLAGSAYFPEEYTQFMWCITKERFVFAFQIIFVFLVCLRLLLYFAPAINCKIINH